MTYFEAHKWLKRTLTENRQFYDNTTIEAFEKALDALRLVGAEKILIDEIVNKGEQR